MLRSIYASVLAVIFLPLSVSAAEFYVSPKGDDAGPGSKDRPLATLAKARDAVRESRKTHPEENVTVWLGGGTYYLDKTLEYGPEDSGSEKAPVVYAAAEGEKVVVSGGRRLEGGRWGEINGHKAWIVEIPAVKEGTWRFRQLFVGDQRRPRTRLPKEGMYRVAALPDLDKNRDSWGQASPRFVYAGTDIQRWRNLQDVDVVASARWVDSRMSIRDVDVKDRVVTFDRRPASGLVEVDGKTLGSYWVENVVEALDTAGQWYLDVPKHQVYYLPAADEDAATAEIIAPRLERLVKIAGRPDAPVKHLAFQGITFAHTECTLPAGVAGYRQAAVGVSGAIFLAHAVNCRLNQCVVEHVGGYAVEVGEGCSDIDITRNRITDLGAGGVKIGDYSKARRGARLASGQDTQRVTVADNEIGRGGRLFLSAVGVWIGHSPGNTIVHNHIYDLNYSGVSVGWRWDFEKSKAIGNIIEYNHIHDIGHGVLSDMGGIYTLGVSPGTRLRYNVIHDVICRDYGGWGIYPDEGSSEILIENNLVYRCTSGGLFAHHTHNVTADNNIFAYNRSAQVDRGGIGGFELACRRNLICCSDGKATGGYGSAHIGREVCQFDHNLYWNESAKPLMFGDKSFAQWQAAGQDKDSIVADPLFVDAEKGDFRLREGSPALKIGFKPWDFSTVGPRPISASPNKR